MEKSKRRKGKKDDKAEAHPHHNGKGVPSLIPSSSLPSSVAVKKKMKGREEWEIDPPKLLIKSAIACGTFDTVHRGIYDSQDVANSGEEGQRTGAEIVSLRAAFAQEVAVWHGTNSTILMLPRLSYLHSQKIMHQDVKSENMLLDKTRNLKIADFGVARFEASNSNDMTESKTCDSKVLPKFSCKCDETLLGG